MNFKNISLAAIVGVVCFVPTIVGAVDLVGSQNDSVFKQAKLAIDQRATVIATQANNKQKPKNIILFVGDGMGIATITAARLYSPSSFDDDNLITNTALVKTYNTNQQIPDSAGTMTAMLTGVKTKAGVIGVDESVARGGKCGDALKLKSLIDYASDLGLATGVITTARLTHATPAAAYAHVTERGLEFDKRDAKTGKYISDCTDIAKQLVNLKKPLTIAMGGGKRNFLKAIYDKGNSKYKRTDGDLTKKWLQRFPQGEYVQNTTELLGINNEDTTNVLGLFSESHMAYEFERKASEPSLTEMTKAAIDFLQAKSSGDRGFFLIVESGRIDHGHHDGNAYKALTETIEFINAIQTAKKALGREFSNTLMLVTADHGHTLTITGSKLIPESAYKAEAKDILGLSDKDSAEATNKNYTLLGYANGPGGIGHQLASKQSRPRPINTDKSTYQQQALINLGSLDSESETHSGADVSLYASGPGAHLVGGVVEQSYIFQVIADALNVDIDKYSIQ